MDTYPVFITNFFPKIKYATTNKVTFKIKVISAGERGRLFESSMDAPSTPPITKWLGYLKKWVPFAISIAAKLIRKIFFLLLKGSWANLSLCLSFLKIFIAAFLSSICLSFSCSESCLGSFFSFILNFF